MESLLAAPHKVSNKVSTRCTAFPRLDTYGRPTFLVTGPTVCNSLRDFIRDQAVSTDCFRRALKRTRKPPVEAALVVTYLQFPIQVCCLCSARPSLTDTAAVTDTCGINSSIDVRSILVYPAHSWFSSIMCYTNKTTYFCQRDKQGRGQDFFQLVDKISRMQKRIRNVKGPGKEVPHRGRGAKEHITHFHHDLSTETAAIRGRGGYPQYPLKNFVIGLVKISQVTLAMHGWAGPRDSPGQLRSW